MRKLLYGVVIFIVCVFSVFPYAYAEKDNFEDLETEQEQLQQKLEDANGELDEVKEELSKNLNQIQKIDEKIISTQQELDSLNIKLQRLQNSIEEVKKELDVAEENFNNQNELLEKRLVAIYEAGDVQYLDIVLSSKNISEFLSNYFLIVELTKYDTDLLDELNKKKMYIKSQHDKLKNNEEQIGIVKQNYIKTSTILENSKIVRENYVSRLTEQEKEIQTKIDEYNTRFAEINAEILKLAVEGLDSKYIGGELAWPVPGYTRISSKYGMRVHPITGIYKLHTGTDISAPMGANFVAANDGIVTKAEMNSAYGNMVIIDHGGGISTLYAHGSEILVEVGQIVKRGESVLKVGSTGYSTGPHAHFEVRIDGVVTDPMPYITNGVIPKNDTEKKEDRTDISSDSITN